jgi:hypothetical protein
MLTRVIIEYKHHGERVSCFENMKGKHKDFCLCWRCQFLHPGKDNNCSRAQELFEFDVKNGMVTPVFECPKFKETNNGDK